MAYSIVNIYLIHLRRSRSFSPPRPRKPIKVITPAAKATTRPRPPSPSQPVRRMPRPMTPPPAKRVTRPNPSDRPTDPRRQPPPPRPRGSTGEIINVRGVKPPAKPTIVKKPAEKSAVQPVSILYI